MLRAALIMAALDAGSRCASSRSPPDTLTHAPTTVYDRWRQNSNRHAAYVAIDLGRSTVVVDFMAGGRFVGGRLSA